MKLQDDVGWIEFLEAVERALIPATQYRRKEAAAATLFSDMNEALRVLLGK